MYQIHLFVLRLLGVARSHLPKKSSEPTVKLSSNIVYGFVVRYSIYEVPDSKFNIQNNQSWGRFEIIYFSMVNDLFCNIVPYRTKWTGKNQEVKHFSIEKNSHRFFPEKVLPHPLMVVPLLIPINNVFGQLLDVVYQNLVNIYISIVQCNWCLVCYRM